MRWRHSSGRSRPVRLPEVLVHGHDRGHGLAAPRHDSLILSGIRDHVAARVDPADGRRHVRLHADQAIAFKLDPQRGRGVIFGSKPMLTITESTSRTVFFSVRLSYTTARSTFPSPSRLVTSALKS